MTRLNPIDRCAEILEAAIELSHRYGYQHVTRKDVAHAAGCSEALVSSYFGTMDQMRWALVDVAINRKDLRIIAQALAAEDSQALSAPRSLRLAAIASLA